MPNIKPYLGLAGALLAAITVEFNDQVSSQTLIDIRGGLGISSDPGTWLNSLYATGQVIGMGVATSLAVGFTLRRFSLFAYVLCMAVTLAIPFCPNLAVLYMLRFLQGLSGGFIIPLLLTVALRLLTPPMRLYGLGAYALTATFAPNLSTTIAALWADLVNWRFVFFQDLPLFTLCALLVWYGLPQDAPDYPRLKKFDWRGAILLTVAASALVTMLEQGNRLDWFNSPLICVLALTSGICLPLFVLNETRREVPLFGLWLLRRRNFAYAAVALFTFLIIAQSASTLPTTFLEEVAGFRPIQIYPITLEVALLELIMLPVAVLILDHAWVDARVVSLIGLGFILAADLGASRITGAWIGGNLFLLQALQTIGQPLFVLSLLMMATNTIRDPKDGPFAASMINAVRATAEPVALWLIQLITRWRGGLHYNRIADQLGRVRYRVVQAQGLVPGDLGPLLPNGRPRTAGALDALRATVRAQATVLTIADSFLIFGALVVMLMLLVLLAERTYPPRVLFARK